MQWNSSKGTGSSVPFFIANRRHSTHVNTFLFYDIETTGLSKSFDQVLQFAAIRTDLALNELDRYTLIFKLRPDIIPSPRAILTHGIALQSLEKGVPELDGIQQIHAWMNTPATISLGYNTLGFDDEFLRFSFYRNLLPPYTHQYQAGCSRMDLYPMAIIYFLYKNQILTWPNHTGKVSLKLEDLNQANQLAEGKAHDAMVDVKATVALAEHFIKDKATWSYLTDFFGKKIDKARIAKLPVTFESAAGPHRTALYVSGEFGFQNRYQIPVLSLGDSVPYPNQSLWLRLDQGDLDQTTIETVGSHPYVIRKKYGEPGFILPPYPRYWQRLGSERQKIVSRNIDWLKAHPALFTQLIQYFRNFKYPLIPNLDIDAAIYQNGFFSPQEQDQCREFHQGGVDHRLKVIERLTNPGLKDLALRLLFRNFPNDTRIPDPYGALWQAYMKRVIRSDMDLPPVIDYKGQARLSPPEALTEIDTILNTDPLSDEQRGLLNHLAAYIRKQFN